MEITKKVFPIPRPSHPFPQTLVKKNEEGKYYWFITMLKQFYINVLLIKALDQMHVYAKFIKDLVTKKKVVSFKMMIGCNITVLFLLVHLGRRKRILVV